jgi:hypothetical protein
VSFEHLGLHFLENADDVLPIVKLAGDFALWLASPEADFLNGRYMWAAWDVDEMIAMKEKVGGDPSLLTMSLVK